MAAKKVIHLYSPYTRTHAACNPSAIMITATTNPKDVSCGNCKMTMRRS